MRIKKIFLIKLPGLSSLVSIKAITMLELLVSLIVVSIMVLSFYSLEEYSHSQVIFSERRTKVQNELSYALEHMGKYVGQANGTKDDPGIKVNGSTFQVRVDMNNLKSPPEAQTPNNAADDALISYSLTGAGNTLSTSCAPCNPVIFPGACASFVGEDLSSKIAPGFFSNTAMTDPLPDPLVAGFYVYINPANVAEIGLIGRYDTSIASHFIKNPQVVMKTKLICNNCSTN